MDRETKTRIEYEHQLYGFSSDALFDSFKDMLTDIVCDNGLKSLAKMIRNKLEPSAKDPEALNRALDEMVAELKTSYESGIDYAFEQYEGKVKECFRIPENILLPEDQIVASVVGVKEEDVDKEIADLMQELKNIEIAMEQAKEEQLLADETIKVLEEADKKERAHLFEV